MHSVLWEIVRRLTPKALVVSGTTLRCWHGHQWILLGRQSSNWSRAYIKPTSKWQTYKRKYVLEQTSNLRPSFAQEPASEPLWQPAYQYQGMEEWSKIPKKHTHDKASCRKKKQQCACMTALSTPCKRNVEVSLWEPMKIVEKGWYNKEWWGEAAFTASWQTTLEQVYALCRRQTQVCQQRKKINLKYTPTKSFSC